MITCIGKLLVKNHATGEKSVLIKLFDKKYMGDFIDFMEDYNACNLSMKFKQLPRRGSKRCYIN